MNRLIVFAVAIFSSLAVASKGGVDVGGGGIGAKTPAGLALLDLYDYGVPEASAIGERGADFSLELAFDCKDIPCDLLSRKLVDIESVDPVLAAFVLQTLKTLTWNFSNSELRETEDAGPIITKVETVQLAVRQAAIVTIYAPRYHQLSRTHQAALFIHECFAALSQGKMTAPEVRRAVATVFSAKLRSLDFASLSAIFGSLPATKTVAHRYDLEWKSLPLNALHARHALDPHDAGAGYALFPEASVTGWLTGDQTNPLRLVILEPNEFATLCSGLIVAPTSANITLVGSLRVTSYFARVEVIPGNSEDAGPYVAWKLKTNESVIPELGFKDVNGQLATSCNASFEKVSASLSTWADSMSRGPQIY